MAEDLVDQLLRQTGLHVGTSTDTRQDGVQKVARIEVSALPGRSGVAIDYEGFPSVATPENPFGHAEHAVLARTSEGLGLFTAHMHAPVLAHLTERETGKFEPIEGTSPFPLAIAVDVPSPGRLIYTWSFEIPGAGQPIEIVGDVTLVA